MEYEFRILCNESQACPSVKETLKKMGFVSLKDLPNSPSFDLSAKISIDDEKQSEKIAREIFERCRNKVQTVEFPIKN